MIPASMRYALAIAALTLTTSSAGATEAPRRMIQLVPPLIAATVSRDAAEPGDVPAAAFASCLVAQGMKTDDMQRAIRSAKVDPRMGPCLDKYVGL